MNKENYWVIGDVHGYYYALLALIAKLPVGAILVFVGDVIDNWSQGAQVVKYVRENKCLSVMGNHEWMVMEYAEAAIESILRNEGIPFTIWTKDGGYGTLQSYGLIERSSYLNPPMSTVKYQEGIDQMRDDIQWMKQLPLYIELPVQKQGRPVVISHHNISWVWHERYHQDPSTQEKFENEVLWGRNQEACEVAGIFNIFGHTPLGSEITKSQYSVNVDTKGYGRLSAYCVETGESLWVNL